MPLRQAKTDVKQIPLGDDAYIGVVEDISKGDFIRLVQAMPDAVDDKKGLTPQEGLQFQTALFEIFVKTWSLDKPVTIEEYLKLDTESASAVDEALINHFSALTPDAPKGKGRKT